VLRVNGNSGRWPVLARQSAKEAAAQWLWFASGIDAERVGYGDGPLTWARSARQKIAKRDIHICLLTCSKDPLQLGPLTAWTINQRSRHCSASVNDGLDRADIVWVYAQDPLTPECRAEFEHKLLEARPEAKVINRPSAYNSYHQGETFDRLGSHGISVPRSSFSAEDLGATRVVYKEMGRQAAPKRNVLYGGPRPGMTAFEFIDSAQQDGLHRRFRAHYFLGMVRPSELFLSDHWNVCMRNVLEVQYGFRLAEDEIAQIRSIANLLELDYFAVDFVRRASDDQPFFTDINVYPNIASPRQLVHRRGDFGKWHTFDACARLGLDEPLGGCVWDHFDSAVINFAHGGRTRAVLSAAAAWSTAAGTDAGAHKSRQLSNAAGLHLALPAGVGERLDGQDVDWASSDRASAKAASRSG
jgi:hypothetical protein